MPHLRSSTVPDLLRRLGAAGVAALVLALSVFAASPTAHEWLHECEHAPATEQSSEDACAVVLFASGVSMPIDRIAVREPMAVVDAISPVTAAAVYLISPRYLRRPERGPPAS